VGLHEQVYAVPLDFGAAGVRAGKPEALFKIDAEAYAIVHSVVSSDVSADGSRFMIPSITPERVPPWLRYKIGNHKWQSRTNSHLQIALVE
jgi:hypothetical protein